MIYTLLALSIHCTHIYFFFIHSYTAQNDSSFNDGATGDALQEPPEAFTCMRIFFFLSYILYFLRDKFLQSRVLIMCTCNFKHTTSFFYLILAYTYIVLESDAYPICRDALYVSYIFLIFILRQQWVNWKIVWGLETWMDLDILGTPFLLFLLSSHLIQVFFWTHRCSRCSDCPPLYPRHAWRVIFYFQKKSVNPQISTPHPLISPW